MSAIAALWYFDGRPEAAAWCEAMLSSLEIYGPDSGAAWSERGVALGMRQALLLPEDRYEQQPLLGAGGRIVLVCDIRIDNRGELASDLALSAEASRWFTDARLFLAAFERWGEACTDRIAGDYAFAVWRNDERRLLLGRDPLGQRPLHYHLDANRVAAASMPRGLHALPSLPRRPDERRLAEFLALLPEFGAGTYYGSIERVEPGQVLAVTRGRAVECHRRRLRRHRLSGNRPGDFVEGVRAHLDEAVRSRLRARAGIGAHLSGGIDSTAVVATAARQLESAGGALTAFTAVPRAGYARPNSTRFIFDEGQLAAQTAGRYPNVAHVLVRSEGRTPLDDLDRYAELCGCPPPNLCNLTWLLGINEAARARGVGVLLTGQAGNAGLSYSGRQLLPELVGRGRWLSWVREALVRVRKGASWAAVVGETVWPWYPTGLWDRLHPEDRFAIRNHSALSAEAIAAWSLDRRARVSRMGRLHRGWTSGLAMRRWALAGGDTGRYQKGMLAWWGIDLRDPTADTRLLEFCLSVPTEAYAAGGESRVLARRALADRVPAAVLDERRTGYQCADWHERLDAAKDRAAATIAALASSASARRLLDFGRLEALMAHWPTTGWHRVDAAQYYRTMLLRALAAGRFLLHADSRD